MNEFVVRNGYVYIPVSKHDASVIQDKEVYALLNDGSVVNTVFADEEDIKSYLICISSYNYLEFQIKTGKL